MVTPGYKNLRADYNLDKRATGAAELPPRPHFMRHTADAVTVTLRGQQLDIIRSFYARQRVDVHLMARYKLQGRLHCLGGGTGNAESHWSATKGAYGSRGGGSGLVGTRQRSDGYAKASSLLNSKREGERTLDYERAQAKRYTSKKFSGSAVNSLSLRALKIVEDEYDAMEESELKTYRDDGTSSVRMVPTTVNKKAAAPRGAPWEPKLTMRVVGVRDWVMTCTCPYWDGMGLPCKHMLHALGVDKGTDVDVNLVLPRWWGCSRGLTAAWTRERCQ